MKHVAKWALNTAAQRGASYADVRVVAQRSRALTTKNSKVGSASDAESVGMSVRVIADGAWGFAASAELGRGAVEASAAGGVAGAGAAGRGGDARLRRNWAAGRWRLRRRRPWRLRGRRGG